MNGIRSRNKIKLRAEPSDEKSDERRRSATNYGRVHEHQTGTNPASYTFSRLPVKLVWSVATESYLDAFQWEHRIKGWSRAKKEALIRGDIEGIHEIVKTERKKREQNKRKISR